MSLEKMLEITIHHRVDTYGIHLGMISVIRQTDSASFFILVYLTIGNLSERFNMRSCRKTIASDMMK